MKDQEKPRPTRAMTYPADKSRTLHILVAEDDPTNSTIIRKRLEMAGHTVYITRNGKECALAYREKSHAFDAVLMDLQMPIVDGLTATKMIRESERSGKKRVPILVTSSSSTERDRQVYIDCGFDGWIMKPVDFGRIGYLLDGVYRDEFHAVMRNVLDFSAFFFLFFSYSFLVPLAGCLVCLGHI